MSKNNLEDLFLPQDLCLKFKEIGFKELSLASFYTDDKRNKSEKYDYKNQFAGLEYHPVDKFGVEWEPNFIINTKETYYVSAPTWDQAETFLEGLGYEFNLETSFDIYEQNGGGNGKEYWFDIYKKENNSFKMKYESDFYPSTKFSKKDVRKMMLEKMVDFEVENEKG